MSVEQAGHMYEYAMFVGKGNPKNAKIMDEAILKTFGEPKAKKMFSLVDFYRSEGIQQGRIEAIENFLKEGLITKEQAEKKIQELKAQKC
ncbi:MAG: hypothetical protein AAF443_08210 [Chlamydiota bacterium]